MGSTLLFILIPLIVIIAIALQQPQPIYDWDQDFLPLAKDLMGTTNADHEIFKGLTVVITGATSGLGKALTLLLTSKGATVVAIGRSKSKLEQLKLEVADGTTTNAGELVPIIMEQSDLQSVADAADQIKELFLSIDVLVCNAGMHYQKGFLSTNFWKDMWSTDRLQTSRGHDLSFTVNYLSHFLLTEKLLPELLSNDGAAEDGPATTKRPMVLHMTSSFHWGADGRDLEPSIGADGITKNLPPAAQPGGGSWWWRGPRAYTNSKLAQILHGRALQKNHQPGVRNVFVCPGWAATSIGGDKDSLVHTGLALQAFPLKDNGWGLQSTLRALLDRQHDDQDFFINTNLVTIAYSMPLQSAFPAWVSETGLRDLLMQGLAGTMLFLQKFFPSSTSTLSSVESYNMTLANNLYVWTKEEVKEFL